VQLYITGETTYSIEDKGKMTSVEVKRKTFTLNQEAIDCFEKIHEDWELDDDALVGGEKFALTVNNYMYV